MSYSAETPITKVFKGLDPTKYVGATVADVPYQHELRQLAMLACEAEQAELLNHLWSKVYPPDIETSVIWFHVAKAGLLHEFFEPNSPSQRDKFQMMGQIFQQGKLKGAAEVVELGRKVNQKRNPFNRRRQ